MEDTRILNTLRTVPPFSCLKEEEVARVATRVDQVRTPARIAVAGNSSEMMKNLFIVMSGEYEVRCQIMVTSR